MAKWKKLTAGEYFHLDKKYVKKHGGKITHIAGEIILEWPEEYVAKRNNGTN